MGDISFADGGFEGLLDGNAPGTNTPFSAVTNNSTLAVESAPQALQNIANAPAQAVTDVQQAVSSILPSGAELLTGSIILIVILVLVLMILGKAEGIGLGL